MFRRDLVIRNYYNRSNEEIDQLWEQLEEGDPMEYEDKWGKKCPP